MEDRLPLLRSSAGRYPHPAITSHHQCFACGKENPDGLNLRFAINPDGVAEGAWQPLQIFSSYPDRIHGGILATMMDSAIVHALFARGIAGVTAELTVRYLHGVGFDSAITVRGWVEASRHRIYQCRAEIIQKDRLAARASAKFMEIREGTPQGKELSTDIRSCRP
ncbi:PaaI family thioesterase [Terrimicrobium sacchariphilum]|uniref:PaaI family thioesterase n=1 Tax=Terrimicrobium sacchariphilum TaxID=690879 RepID=UPI0009466136|nr:PaaI family thioesterase [Terrimicrobium sacchariphilum]